MQNELLVSSMKLNVWIISSHHHSLDFSCSFFKFTFFLKKNNFLFWCNFKPTENYKTSTRNSCIPTIIYILSYLPYPLGKFFPFLPSSLLPSPSPPSFSPSSFSLLLRLFYLSIHTHIYTHNSNIYFFLNIWEQVGMLLLPKPSVYIS